MSRTFYLSIVVWGVVSLVAAWTDAGPFAPAPPRVPEEALSLSGLTRFQLGTIPLTPLLREADVKVESLVKLIARQLQQEGISLGEDPLLPRLSLVILTDTNPDQRGAVSLTTIMAVHQKAHINRIDRSLTVPTATTGNTALTTRKGLSDAVEQSVQRAVQTLLDYMNWVSRPEH